MEKPEKIIDCHTHVGISTRNHLTQAFPYAMSIEDLVVRMKLLGVSKSVVFPFESSYYLRDESGNAPGELGKILSSFPYEKENTALLVEINEVFPEFKDMLIPFAMFDPSRETARQAGHLAKLHSRYRIRGLKTVTTYIKAFVKDFQAAGNPIRDFAIREKLPITFHCSWLKSDIWANVFDVLEIAEENPDLNICLAHSVRFSREALDRAAALPNCFVDSSAFKIHCDLAASGSDVTAPPGLRFESDYSRPEKVLRDIAQAYPDTILWGSDTPYHYFAQPWTDSSGQKIDVKLMARYDDEIRILRSIPANLAEKISYANTVRFLSSTKKGG